MDPTRRGPSPAFPEDRSPKAAHEEKDHLSELPAEMRANIFKNLSPNDTARAGAGKVLRESATNQTRRSEGARSRKVIEHITARLPAGKEVLAAKLNALLKDNPVKDAESIGQVRDRHTAIRSGIVRLMDELNIVELTNVMLGGFPEPEDKLYSELKVLLTDKELFAQAAASRDYNQGIELLQEYARVNRQLPRADELARAINPDSEARVSFCNQLAWAGHQSKNPKLISKGIANQIRHTHQRSQLGQLFKLVKDDPKLLAE